VYSLYTSLGTLQQFMPQLRFQLLLLNKLPFWIHGQRFNVQYCTLSTHTCLRSTCHVIEQKEVQPKFR
jgi:hypothetical protein